MNRPPAGSAARAAGLWHNPDFVRLWSAATISTFGSLVTRTALPFTAILVLNATPFQMGLLAAADLGSQLLMGLVAGAWVDRLRRRPILIVADLGRAALLATIPLAAFFSRLSMTHLYVVAFLAGIHASIRFSVLGAMLAGALIGGTLGETIGLRSTLAVAACGVLLSSLWLVFSPVRTLRRVAPSSVQP